MKRALPVLVLLMSFPALALAECPANTVTALANNLAGSSRTSTAPQDGVSAGINECWQDPPVCFISSGRAAYDLTVGTAEATSYGAANGYGDASVHTRDVFTVSGPGSAGAVTFHAVLHTQVYVSSVFDCAGIAYTVMRVPGVAVDSVGVAGCGNSTQDLSVTITAAAGSTFDLRMDLHVEGTRVWGTYAGASASLSFPDLPLGYNVTSCQGFSALPIVAASRGSWGSLKARYR
jgi:hypothetical protein